MYKARYYKADGKKGRARALPDALFDGVVNEAVMHQVVKAYLANQRQGTAAARNRSAVRGGSRKPWRQKGTGRARQGTTRAAQWTGGGVAFPPIPHSWRQRVPRKVRVLARRSALNDRAEHDRVILIDVPALEAPRTRAVREFLEAVGVAGGKVLILTDGINRTLYLSARNLPNVEVLPFGEESVYDVLWAHSVLIERSAVERAVADDAPAAKAPQDAEAAAPQDEAPAPEPEAAAPEPEAAAEDAGDAAAAGAADVSAADADAADETAEGAEEGDDA